MSFFDRVRGIFAARQAPPPMPQRASIAWPMRADSEVWITEEAAVSCGTAWACGSLVARSLAMLPADVMQPGAKAGDGNQHLADHPVEALLNREPNPEQTAIAFREQLALCALFHGNGFAEIEWDILGRPLALWPIHPSRVETIRDDEGGLAYAVDTGRAKVTLPAENMLHIAGPSLDGILGLSLISYARNTLGLAIAQERFAGAFIANAGAPSGILRVKGNISDEGLKRMRSEVDTLYRGPRQAGRVAIVDATTEWEQVGLSFLDAEFLAQRKFSVEQICSIFGVPPQMVGSLEKMTFANAEQAALNFLTLALLPWAVRFEQEVNRKLLTRPGRRVPFLKLNTSAIVRADIERRNRSYALGRQWGWLSVNDIRRLEDMPPIGPEGDVYLQPVNMEPAEENVTLE